MRRAIPPEFAAETFRVFVFRRGRFRSVAGTVTDARAHVDRLEAGGAVCGALAIRFLFFGVAAVVVVFFFVFLTGAGAVSKIT